MNDESTSFKTLLLKAALASLLLACSGTGQPEVSYPAYAIGSSAEPFAADDWTVTLEEATVAFGPVYFCAARSGSATLCETAVGEITRITSLNALTADPQPIGTVHGFEGDVRSASYDYGVHWFLTESAPVADPAAPNGHSLHVRGTARRGADELPFVAEVDALAQYQGCLLYTSPSPRDS